jgi:peptidase-like protein
MPQSSIDPVVMAAATVLRLQTIVSREVAPTDAVVVTVGSLQAGTKENVIPDEAVIKLNVRTFDEDVRKRVLAAIERIVNAEAEASRAPKKSEITPLDRYATRSGPLRSSPSDMCAAAVFRVNEEPVEKTEAPRQCVMVRSDGVVGKVDETRVASAFFNIAEQLIVGAVLFNDVDDVLKWRIAARRAPLLPVVRGGDALCECRELLGRHGKRRKSTPTFRYTTKRSL